MITSNEQDQIPMQKEEKTGISGDSDTGENPEEESFREMFEASLKQGSVPSRGKVIKGVVVGMSDDQVLIDIGAKDEGMVAADEFEQIGEQLPAIGDEIQVLVQSLGGRQGSKLSVLAARQQAIWKKVDDAMASGETLPVLVKEEVKGGFRVDLGGLPAFMPRSESDIHPRATDKDKLGKTIEVAIISSSRRTNNIVVSRKQPLEAEINMRKQAFFEKARLGEKVTGKVRRLTEFGAFVDIGGVDALLHVSDIAWRRLEHPKEMLEPGQQILAEITKLDAEMGKVSISMRALQPDPWEMADKKYKPGMRLTGTVRRLLDFGAMVELEPGVEGMIHRSELAWTRKEVNPASVLTVGDVVDVALLDVDAAKRRISLSLKEVSENPWKAWLAGHPVGTRIEGPVKSITDFGLFVGMDADLDGLVHIGDLSWKQPGEEALKEYSKGQKVECVVLGVDVDRQRISLGIKQLTDDPFDVFMAGAGKGSVVKGKVVSVEADAAVVEVGEGIRARLPHREMPRDHDALKAGDSVEAKVVEINRKRRRIGLSVRQMLHDEERDAVRNYSKMQEQDAPLSALALELQRKVLNRKKSTT